MNDKLAAIARQQHGVFSRRQALDSGMTRAAIRTAVRLKLWQVVMPRVFTVRGAPVTHLSRAWAVWLTLDGAVAFTGRTALLIAGAPDLDPDAPVEAAILNTRRERRLVNAIVRRVTPHWMAQERSETDLPTLRPAAAVFDYAATNTEPEVRRVVECCSGKAG